MQLTYRDYLISLINKHLLRKELLLRPFYRWRNKGLEVKFYAHHLKTERELNPRQLASRNHKFGQVTTLLHPKLRTLWDLRGLPFSWAQAPCMCPLGGLQTPYLYQIHESTEFTKRGTNILVNIRTQSTGRNVGRIPTGTKCTPQSGVVVQKITSRSHCFNEGNIFLALISFPL